MYLLESTETVPFMWCISEIVAQRALRHLSSNLQRCALKLALSIVPTYYGDPLIGTAYAIPTMGPEGCAS